MDYKIEICISFECSYFYTFILFSAHINDFLGKQYIHTHMHSIDP